MIPTEIRKWVALGVLVAVICIALAVLSMCRAQDAAKTAQAGETLANGRTAASADVNDIRDAADERISAINADVKDATDAIRSAPDPVSRDRAALRGLCDIDPSASPDCRLLNANP